MNVARYELLEWLDQNKPLFKGRNPHEIGYMAVMCGFVLEDVCAVLSTWAIDSECRNTSDRRAQIFITDEMRGINRVQGLDLTKQWMELAMKLLMDKDFND